MSKSKRGGYFITFEGPEGSGKSTQIRYAEQHLRKKGYHVLVLREPGGTRTGEAIRKILLDKKRTEMTPEAELMLYLAARAQIVRERIVPALKKGQIVICDRYEDSTIAYQGYGRKFSVTAIKKISESIVRGKYLPQRTFLLDISPDAGLKRGGRHDRMERQKMSFHRDVRKGYLALAKNEPRRFVVIDAQKSRVEIKRRIAGRLDLDLG